MPKPYDHLTLFGKFGAERNLSLRDQNAIDAYAADVAEKLRTATSDSAFVHGQRTEAMFEAMLDAFGGFTLVKREDVGVVVSERRLRVPDFRVVLRDGTNLLIEVKNVHEDDPFRQERRIMNKQYLEEMEAYAKATGAQLKLAIYWSRWSIWTLITPSILAGLDGSLRIKMTDALMASEMGLLGDCAIGTRPPLILRLVADPSKSSSIDAEGNVKFTIGGVKFFAGNEEIVDSGEKEVAWTLINYGRWGDYEPRPEVDGDKFLGVAVFFEPSERSNPNEDFEIVGSLSSMFSQYFKEATIKNGEVARLEAPPRPGWFVTLRSGEIGGGRLPLWRFIQKPQRV